MEPNEKLGRLAELESLRGFAALLVVLFHMPQWYPPFHAIPLIRNGGYMVDLFFVLSGFVIARAYGSRMGTVKDIVRFQLVRLGRLYPVHLLFLLLFLTIEIARYFLQSSGLLSSGQQPFAANSLDALGLQLILGQALGQPHYWGTFNGPAWSISIEFYGYLLFALAAFIGGRLRLFLFFMLFVAGATMLATGWDFNSNISRFLAGFFAGTCLALLTLSRENSLPSWTPAPALALLIASVWFKGDSLVSILGIVVSSALVIGTLATARGGWFKGCCASPPV